MNYREYAQNHDISLDAPDAQFDLSRLVMHARLYAGITQAELARRIGTKQPSVARAESGLIEPSVSFLERVAKAVGTTLVMPKFSFMIEEEKALTSGYSQSTTNPDSAMRYFESTTFTQNTSSRPDTNSSSTSSRLFISVTA